MIDHTIGGRFGWDVRGREMIVLGEAEIREDIRNKNKAVYDINRIYSCAFIFVHLHREMYERLTIKIAIMIISRW